jgi:hypothetical protein
MPTIAAVAVPVPGYVYVETDWSDVPAATHVCVDRVDTATGERFPLRAYVSYDAAGCLALSCGLGIFWDTELSFDTEYQYCATVTDAAGAVITTVAANLVTDTFTRVVAAGWGTADTGQVWTSTGGAAADYSATGTRGQHAVTSTGVARVSSIPMATPNAVAQATAFPAAVALTQSTEQHLWLRADAAGLNGYKARLRFNTAATVDLILERVTAGVPTALDGIVAVGPYIATTGITVKFSAWGSALNVKAWDSTTPEPAAYQITVTDTVFTASGTLNLGSLRNIGNTNGTVNMQWDNLTVVDVCAEPVPIEACSNPVTIDNDGCFRLGDPVRPCSDRHVCLGEESDCSVEEAGVYFGSMTPGRYADNSGQLLPVNARRPIVVSRERRDVQADLVLVTRTFTDRDDVLDLAEPGSPLLWRGPASYGTGNPYMSVLDVDLSASFLDLQQQPRVIAMPFWAVDAPVGPSLGVCGTRVDDLCDVYATWDAMAAAGLTYAGILRGLAGTGVSVALATWNDVNADFATWNALNAGETDWVDTWTGFP